MKNQWLYKVSTALLIVMLAVAALPVSSAYAAVSRPTDWTSVGSAQGTGAALNVAGTYAAAAGTQRYTLLAVFVVNTGANITPTVSGNWGGVAFSNAGVGTRYIGQYGSATRRGVYLFGFNEVDIAGRANNNVAISSSTTTAATYMQGYMSTYAGVDQVAPYTFGSGGDNNGSATMQYTGALNTVNGSYGAAVLGVGGNTGGGVTNTDVAATPNTAYAMNINNAQIGASGTYATLATKAFTATDNTRPIFTFANNRNILVGVVLAPAATLIAQTITFTSAAPAAAVFAGATYTPTATATSGLPVTITVDATASTVCSIAAGVVSFIGVGNCVLNANQVGNGTYSPAPQVQQSFAVGRATPTASVSNTPQNFTGAAQSATVACLGGGAASNIQTGGAASQTNAGTYAVTVNCAASANYNAVNGLATTNSFVINRINPTASVGNTPQNYTGAAQSATVACLGGGVASNILTGGAATQTNAGTYAVTVNCAVSTNYNAVNGLPAGNFVINRIAPTASITNSPVSYNGSAQTAAVACSGGGVATLVTGTGTGTNIGSYAATVNCAISTNYNAANGLAAGNFVINPIAPTITVTNGPMNYDGLTHAATVSCLGGGAASNIQTGGAASQTNAGTYAVTANCAANGNYGAATGLTAGNSFVINRITPTASVSNTPQTYTGAAQSATVACLGGGAASNISTGGAATQTDAGTYAVTADCAISTNYNAVAGLAAGNFVIDPATPTASVTNTPQSYTGAAQSATVACSGGGAASNILTGGAATQTNANTYAVTADCAASANYTSATSLAAGNFVIGSIGQSITVTTNAPASASNGSTFNVAATASSGLIVDISATGVCTFVDNGDGTAAITMTSGSGTCSVNYVQGGDVNYTAAAPVQENVNATEGPSFTSANSTSFDVTFPGSFTITAIGNPQSMTISLAGALPSGVTFTNNGDGTATLNGTPALGTNGTYPLSLTANNGVAPNATQSFTLTVKSGPIVGANGINSTPDTGDGKVGENESIIDTLGLTKLTVQFSQDVYDDPTDVLDYGHDATNPANYILVRSTTTSFATIDCAGGVVAPDVSIKVNSVAYNKSSFVATLSINDGFPLNVVGFYRLYVCGTTSIVDATNRGLELAGNGTTPGTDFQRNFRISTVVAASSGGDGSGKSSTTSTLVTSGFLIPVTGFAPNQVTTLPMQPADQAYAAMGQMTIEIPALGVKFPIVGASIQNKTWDLTWLKDSVAYLEGSAYPTTAGNTVLTAHVQDANKNLGPFSDIKGLTVGQNIYIHVNGQTYVYQVQESSKISPTGITSMFKHEEDSWITLVTCEDFNAKTGSYSSRRMVRAVLISVISSKK